MPQKMYSLKEVQESLEYATKKMESDISNANKRVNKAMEALNLPPSDLGELFLSRIATTTALSLKVDALSYLDNWDEHHKENKENKEDN